MRKARRNIRYHGREGRPMIHEDGQGRQYIMVRKKGGGTKRLYEGSLYSEEKGDKSRKRLRLK